MRKSVIHMASGAFTGAAVMAAAFIAGTMVNDRQPFAPVEASDPHPEKIVAVVPQSEAVTVSVLPPPPVEPAKDHGGEAQAVFDAAYASVTSREPISVNTARTRYGYYRTGDAPPGARRDETFGAIAGPATVLDSGAIEISGQRVSLGNIMPIPPHAICERDSGESFDCYNWAVEGMRSWINGREANCALTIRPEDVLGACEIPTADGTGLVDIGSWMVGAGIALPDPSGTGIYDRAGISAREGRVGIWSGYFAFNGVSSQ